MSDTKRKLEKEERKRTKRRYQKRIAVRDFEEALKR
jgi:hypothetical protein